MKSLKRLELKKLAKNVIFETGVFDSLENLLTLNLSDNYNILNRHESNIFQKLISLLSLDLSNCNISTLNNCWFTNIPWIELNFWFNPIKEFIFDEKFVSKKDFIKSLKEQRTFLFIIPRFRFFKILID